MSEWLTLPREVDTEDRSREPLYPNMPTWARRSVGAGQYARLALVPHGPSTREDDTVDGRRREVWVVPASEWSPGDRIETGPVPDHIRIVFDVVDPYVGRPTYAPVIGRGI